MSHALEPGPLPGDLGRFRRVADAMPHLAWLSDPSGRIEFVNQPWVDYTGISLEMLQSQMLQGQIVGIVHPGERDSTIAAWKAALAEGRPYEIEYRLRRKSDNSYRWFIARALPIRESNAILGWIGTATDIDDERRARETLEFVLEAEATFSGNLDVAAICRTFADVAIKSFADWCFVQIVTPPDALTTLASAHRDAARQHEVEKFIARWRTRARGAFLERLRAGPILAPTVTLEQLKAEAQDAEHLAIMRGLNMHSAMVIPMRGSDDAMLGVVTLIAAESMRTFSAEDLAVAERIARRAGIALEAAQRFEQQRRVAVRLQLLESATQSVYDDPAVDVAEMARRIARAAVPTLADRVTIYFRRRDQLQLLASHDADERMIESAYALSDAHPIAASAAVGALIEENRPYLVREVDDAALRRVTQDEGLLARLRRLEVRSSLVVPLRAQNTSIGAIMLFTCRDSPRRFSDEDIPVAEELATRTAFALDLAMRHEHEHRISQTFQRAALPAELPAIPGTHLSAWYEAGGTDAQVGGDWYDAFRLPDGRLVLSIGDVAGSGLDAAVIMGSVRQSIRTAAIINPEPRRILDAVDRVVRSIGERFVSASVAIFDPLFGELQYACAGHPAALLRASDGSIEELTTFGLPLGLRNLAEGETKSRTLARGSQLLLFTDGLSEVDRDIIAGENHIQAIFAEGNATARGLFTRVMDERRPRDDVAIMLLSFDGSPLDGAGPRSAARWDFETADMRAGTAVRSALRTFLGTHGLAGLDLDQAEIVAGELVGNAVRHAPGNVTVIADAGGSTPVLHVIDEGPGCEFNPRLPPDEMSDGGRGLFIVNALVEEMSIARRSDVPGSHARAVLRTAGTARP
jgi:PAS domain S-box-containing protein